MSEHNQWTTSTPFSVFVRPNPLSSSLLSRVIDLVLLRFLADHRGITSGNLQLRQPQVFDELLASHRSQAGSEAGDDEPAKKKQKGANGAATNGVTA